MSNFMTCWNELLLRPCYYAVEDGIEMVPKLPERREKPRLRVAESVERISKKLPTQPLLSPKLPTLLFLLIMKLTFLCHN